MNSRSLVHTILGATLLSIMTIGVNRDEVNAAEPLPCPGLAQQALDQFTAALRELGLPPGVIVDLSRWAERIRDDINMNNQQALLAQLKALSKYISSLVKSGKISTADGDVLLRFVDQLTRTATYCVSPVMGFSCRSSSAQNVLFWLNPSEPFTSVRVLYRTDRSPIEPNDPAATLLGSFTGLPGSKGIATHSGLIDGTTYYYAAYVDNSNFSLRKTTFGRPDNHPGIYWSYTIGGSRIPVAGIDGDYSIAGEDGVVHRLSPLSAGGYWQASWIPPIVPRPISDRPLTIPLATPTNGESQVVLVSSREGRVYCLSRSTGSILWQSPYLGAEVRANICATLSAFGGLDVLMVGTHDTTGDNKFYGLNVADGSIAWMFDNGGGANGIGPISEMCAAQYPHHVIFTSQRKGGGSQHTAWRLDFTSTSAFKLWSADVGDPSTAFVTVNSAAYIGTKAGEAKALDFATGSPLWSPPYITSDGPVKGFIFPDRVTGRRALSTNTKVHLLQDMSISFTQLWNPPLQVQSPSPAVLIGGTPWLFVGDGAGTVYQYDATSSAPTFLGSVALGDPSKPKQVGPMTFDLRGVILGGTDEGVMYALKYPIAGSTAAVSALDHTQVAADEASLSASQPCECVGPQLRRAMATGENTTEQIHGYSLDQNYPNPFNPETVIKFSVEQTGRATLEVFNLLGQKVATLFDDVAEAGQYYRVRFDGKNLASGVYMYRLQGGTQSDSKKLMLIK